eukprot:TRINITY_DN9333_c0_g3_i1.p2 TRINITY_DN9333_c0_g3~~TRINITY_DN9333_c0_g3_i1.p2  ORF type:complete len:161 (-),score=9.15 TRINITY_DN9333_c0_g3_i1:192-674(-)
MRGLMCGPGSCSEKPSGTSFMGVMMSTLDLALGVRDMAADEEMSTLGLAKEGEERGREKRRALWVSSSCTVFSAGIEAVELNKVDKRGNGKCIVRVEATAHGAVRIELRTRITFSNWNGNPVVKKAHPRLESGRIMFREPSSIFNSRSGKLKTCYARLIH